VEIMALSRTSRLRTTTPARAARSRLTSQEGLGCVAVRRITDDAGRAWRVREFRSQTGLGLFFRCDVPGVPAETRAAVAALESMEEECLVNLLQAGGE
jgi:hypothetical protein